MTSTNKASRELAAVRRAAMRVAASRTAESGARGRLAAAIRAAADAGVTVREIGEAAGLTGARVNQIYHETKEKTP